MLDRLLIGAVNGLLTQGGLALGDKLKKVKLKSKVEQGVATDDEIFKYNELLGDSLEEYVKSTQIMTDFLAKNPDHVFPNVTLGVNTIATIIHRKKQIAFQDMKQLPEFAEVRKYIGRAHELVSNQQDTWLKSGKISNDLFLLYVFKAAQAYYFQGFIEYLDGNIDKAKLLKSDGVKMDKRVLKILAYGKEKGI